MHQIQKEPISSWNENEISSADCAVVLTGATGRVREGFDLLENQKVKKLIVSGVYPEASYEDIFPYWPFYRHINPEDVILERRSQTTFGNALQSVVIVEALKCQSIYLVTSQLHMQRAFRLFHSLYPNNVDIMKYSIANSRSEMGFFSLSVETIKSLFYRIFSLVTIRLDYI